MTSLHSPDILDRLVAEKLEQEADKALETGWKWAEICPEVDVDWSRTQSFARLYPVAGEWTEAQAARFDELAAVAEQDDLDEDKNAEIDALDGIREGCITAEQRAHSGLILYVNWRGELTSTAALVRPDGLDEAVSAGLLAAEDAERKKTASEAETQKAEKPKPDLSAALVADLRAMRNAAIQGRMIDKPELVLDLLAFALTQGYRSPLGIRRDETNIAPSVDDGFACDPRLTNAPEVDEEAEDFGGFRAKGKKHRNTLLAHGLARTLKYGATDWAERPNSLFDEIENEVGASIRQVWTPTTENFFGRVAAPYLDNLLADLTRCDCNSDSFKAFASGKKKEKAEVLERLFSDPETQSLWKIDAERRARIADWVLSGF